MANLEKPLAIDYVSLSDDALVALARSGHREAFRHIMHRCNQRLFRVARGLVHENAEAEDVVQEAYARAFEKLATFNGESTLLTWMTRIVLNEAYGRLRQRRPTVGLDKIDASQLDSGCVLSFPSKFGNEDPAAAAARAQIRYIIERAVDDLPEAFRIVFVMREIEQCTVEETASALDLRAETIKTRLHRARRLLRAALHGTLSATMTDAFPFLGARCDRMTTSVLARLDPMLELAATSATAPSGNTDS